MPVGIDEATLVVMKAIDQVFTKYSFFGSRQLQSCIRRDGIVVGRHCIRRLMRLMGT
jgi:putative transposase